MEEFHSHKKLRIFDWFSFSHWGMFRLALATAPDWYVYGLGLDDELIEDAPSTDHEPAK